MAGNRGRLDWTWLVLTACVVVHLVFLVTVARREPTRLFNDTWNRPGPGADFFAVYHAGRQVLTGRDPYRDDEKPRITPTFAPFRYTPGVAFTLGVAVAAIKPWLAYAGWVVLLEAILLANLLLVRRLVGNARRFRVIAAGWLAFTPLHLELWMGQFTFVAASLLLWAHVAWSHRARPRPALAGGLWAAASAFKLFPLALAPWLLRERRFGALAAGALTLAASCAWFAWHPDDFTIFWRLNFTEVDFAAYHAGNFGLQALVFDLWSLGGTPSVGSWRVVTGVLTFTLLGLATAAMLRRTTDARVATALALLLLPLVSKHVWEHHHVVALPAFTLLALAWAERPGRLWLLACAAVVLAVPSALALLQHGGPDWYPERAWSAPVRALYHAPKPLAVLAVFLFACASLLRREPASSRMAP